MTHDQQSQMTAALNTIIHIGIEAFSNPQPQWHSSFEIPEDGLYIISTSKQVKMFGCVCNGAWLGDVKWWMPIPDTPDEDHQ